MRGEWYARIYRAGETVEISKFYVPAQRPEKGQGGTKNSRRKKDANGAQAIRRLARLLNASFGPGDCLLTLHFDAAGLERIRNDHDTADHQMMLFLRRVQYQYRKRGKELRYIGMTSEMDEETGAPVRLHCHCVISGELISRPEGSREYLLAGRELSAVWGFGSVDVQFLRRQSDYTALAVYLCRQARCLPDEKRWHPSRNLLKPEYVDVPLRTEEVRTYNRRKKRGMPALKIGTDGRVLIPAKCTLLEDGGYIPSMGTHYVRFLLPTVLPSQRQRSRREGGERPDEL